MAAHGALAIDGRFQSLCRRPAPPSKVNNNWRALQLESDGNLSAFEARSGKHLWQKNLPGPPTAIITGDIDGDGELEALFGCRDGGLYCIRDAGDKSQVV